jgi:hypothetical protein
MMRFGSVTLRFVDRPLPSALGTLSKIVALSARWVSRIAVARSLQKAADTFHAIHPPERCTMRLSHLVTTQILAWCILGVAVHGWQLLCYPLAWLGIIAMFVAIDTVYDRVHGTPERLRLVNLFHRPVARKATKPIHVPHHAARATTN